MTSQPTSGLKLPHRYLGPGPRLILGLPSTSGNGGRAVRKRYIERSSRFAEIVEGIVKGLKTPGRFERALLLETVTHPFRPLRRPIFVARGGSHQPSESLPERGPLQRNGAILRSSLSSIYRYSKVNIT